MPANTPKRFARNHEILGTFVLRSLLDTDRIATLFHAYLPPGCCLGLVGTLGAGKTYFTQAFARAAGISQQAVTSPTFTLVHRYQGNRVLYHIDAYRIADTDEFWELGVDEMFDEQAVTLIEWADRMETSLPKETLWIQLQALSQKEERRMVLRGQPEPWKAICAQIVSDWDNVSQCPDSDNQ